jgi:hypothetical protein
VPGPYGITELPALLTLWDRAVNSPHGIKIRTSNVNLLMQKLAAVRRDTHNDFLRKYALCQRPDYLYIVPHENIKSNVALMREGRGL